MKLFEFVCDLVIIILLVTAIYLAKTQECTKINYINTPGGSCISEYNYKIDKFCLYYEDNQGNIELIEDEENKTKS